MTLLSETSGVAIWEHKGTVLQVLLLSKALSASSRTMEVSRY